MPYLVECAPFGPIDTNATLIACLSAREAVAIDVPLGATEWYLHQIQIHHLQLKYIFLTHSHWDHIAEVKNLKEKAKVPVWIHQQDCPNLEKPGSDQLPCFFSISPVIPDDYLEDGQQITLGKITIEIIHTPGHTPGGVCFYLEQQKMLISGDTLFQGSIGNIQFPTSNAKQMWQSLKKLSKLPPDTVVMPGHGPTTTIGEEKWIACPH